MPRLREFRASNMRSRNSDAATQMLITVALTAALGFGAWYATGWPVAALLGGAAGVVTPKMIAAPRQRRAVADEIEAYSQWTEQIRDLVSASGSLFEAVTLSAPSAPPLLRPHVAQMASLAGSVGLKAAMNWFAAHMESPYADRLVLGLSIAWESGARVTEAFETTARSMRTEVEMRRRNEVANARTWTQVVSILGITVVSVLLMFVFNRGFFDPFGSTVGQLILLIVGVLIFGNVFWVLQLSGSGVPIRLLDERGLAGVSDVAALMNEGTES
ncbi:type II secretion system F family protein [Candidatus Poriferisodalis sp.]|uniref:type II secretion system F family protein n=1 Tax=Candidatus Poriferisodalis sp. TaxID=3101277 RepID=UPI003AF5263E